MENKNNQAPRELRGKPVAARIWRDLRDRTAGPAPAGVAPTLAVVRVGAQEDDWAYFTSIDKAFTKHGLGVTLCEFPADVAEDVLCDAFCALSANPKLHGILPLLPFPSHLDATKILQHITAQKDVDGVTAASRAFVYDGTGNGFPPCTAAAVMELLRHYQIPLKGMDVTVLGRSSVVGRPLAMLLLRENATVTICHSRSHPWMLAHTPLSVFAVGKPGVAADIELPHKPILIDCAINVLPDGRVVGDLSDAQREQASAYTPVPGGVGAVTVSVLAKHLVEAAGFSEEVRVNSE
ncbi:MAG: bifunctional 5,10-methylenetetrahydrofolate dehydrogenase/5,10-methenyltetrahydrofolate cyclohydrolase [Clostridiales bacterium]|nr:bifunctional 5,10-methylenetetrahydrofolate dehydrogenase/5,10-methenyltetrahydrofolate cyclohydrolase [Clostridiales bacterium]